MHAFRDINCMSLSDKGQGKGHTLDMVPLTERTSLYRSARVWHALSRDLTVLPVCPRVYP